MNNFFNRNLTAKIISICFALIMWTYVMSDINPKMTREFTSIPVQLLNMEELRKQGLVIVGEVNDQIRVTVKGRRDEIYKINKNDVRATADLKGFKAGVNNIPIDVASLASLGNTEVDYFPKYLKIELEEIVRKQREVDLIISGSPKVGYILNEPRYKPTVVWIEGPASLVNAVDKVVARLELKGEVDEIVASLPLKAVNDKGVEIMNVDIKPPYIDIHLPVDRLKSIRIEPNIQAKAAEGYIITNVAIIPESIALRGQQQILNALETVKTEELVLDKLKENQSVQIPLDLPEGISVFNEEMVTVQITVEPIQEKIIDYPIGNINFVGIQTELEVDLKLLPETIQVKVVASSGILNQLDVKDLRIDVDLKNSGSGAHEIGINASIPSIYNEDIKIQTIPKMLSVKLIETSKNNNN